MKQIHTFSLYLVMSIIVLFSCDQHGQESLNVGVSELEAARLPQQIIDYRNALQEQMLKGYLVKAESVPYLIYPPQYKITIYQDPEVAYWPTWYSLLVKAEIYLSLDEVGSDEVIYEYTVATYQGLRRLFGDMLLEGLRQISGESAINVRTLGLLDDIVITENLAARIRFRLKDLKWKIIKNEDGKIKTVQQEYLTVPERFIEGLQKYAPGYHVKMVPIMTLLPPSGYRVTMESILDCTGQTDCYQPGMLYSLELYGFESLGGIWDREPELHVTARSIQANYDGIKGSPDGDMLYYGMYLFLRQSGIKTISNYMIIAEMSGIRIRLITESGSIIFIDKTGQYWAIIRTNGEVELEKLYIVTF